MFGFGYDNKFFFILFPFLIVLLQLSTFFWAYLLFHARGHVGISNKLFPYKTVLATLWSPNPNYKWPIIILRFKPKDPLHLLLYPTTFPPPYGPTPAMGRSRPVGNKSPAKSVYKNDGIIDEQKLLK